MYTCIVRTSECIVHCITVLSKKIKVYKSSKNLQVANFDPPYTLCLLILFVDKYAFLLNLMQSRQAL